VVRSNVICLPTPRCGIPMDECCTQPLSSDPKIKLEYNSSSLCFTISRLRGISTSWSLSRLTQVITIKMRAREGLEYSHKSTTQQQHTQMQRRKRNNKITEYRLKKCAQISLEHFGGMVVESRSCSVLKVCLMFCSMRLGVPFIAPRGPRSR
jgi:hypothetical protein